MAEKKNSLTGDRPTGPLHLGHYVGSLKNRIDIQDDYNQFIMIADMQALSDNYLHPEKIKKNVVQVLLDYLAVGIDPSKSVIFIQSLIPALFELTLYFLNLITWNRLKHNPTVKLEIKQRNFKDNIPAGFMVYPISQAADILAFKADIVPVGEDQIPMIEQTVEIARRFNKIYKTDVFIEPRVKLAKIKRLPGVDGHDKMSKSLNNAIYLSDEEDVLIKKIKKMYTDPNHLRIEDPGNPDINPVFIYLDAFDEDKDNLVTMKEHYRRGGLADSVVKKRLIEVLTEFLRPIREKRKQLEKDKTEIFNEVLLEGSKIANEIANETLSQAKKAMDIIY